MSHPSMRHARTCHRTQACSNGTQHGEGDASAPAVLLLLFCSCSLLDVHLLVLHMRAFATSTHPHTHCHTPRSREQDPAGHRPQATCASCGADVGGRASPEQACCERRHAVTGILPHMRASLLLLRRRRGRDPLACEHAEEREGAAREATGAGCGGAMDTLHGRSCPSCLRSCPSCLIHVCSLV